jgi:ferrous iron transport protein B
VTSAAVTAVPVPTKLFRGPRRLRIALVGLPRAGKSTLFKAVSSTAPSVGMLAGTQRPYSACRVQVGLDEATVVDLPSITSMLRVSADDLPALQYLLWGDERPPVAAHEPGVPPVPFAPPDVIVQVIDATSLERHLELTLELTALGRPLVLALNMADQAWQKGLYINAAALSQKVGAPVVATVATMGQGIPELFAAAVKAVRDGIRPSGAAPSAHLVAALQPLTEALGREEIAAAFRVPAPLLLAHVAAGDPYFDRELRQHFESKFAELERLRALAAARLPRPLEDELHADRHHRAATLFEVATRLGAPHEGRGWRYWLDELFLHPQGGLLGSMAVFAAVLFVVFQVSGWLDSVTTAQLAAAVADWNPSSTTGVVGRAVVDGVIGLVGIVVPYMIPLVLLLVALEEAGVMQRIAFVVDRTFHKIGLHGGVAVTFLTGLGCNVPAISAVAKSTRGRERVIASVLITFVPCSARSAIILAVAGKYLGGLGVFAIFALALLLIAVLGRLLARRAGDAAPGQVQPIPPYALPQPRVLLMETWARTKDVLTIVSPLLVGGSVVLALLQHIGADAAINALLKPVSAWWLGLPIALGVPILFGVLRKELSLLMIYQALGTFDVNTALDSVQMMTLLLFLTFYVPCVSTFAVMMKTIGRREAVVSVCVSVGVALLVSGAVRVVLQGARLAGLPLD